MTKHQMIDELIRAGLSPGQACYMWPILVRCVAKWIVERTGLLPVQPEDLMRQWQEDMA